MACMRLSSIGGWNARKPHGSDPEKLADERHGVGGELSAASARPRTRGVFQRLEARVGHAAMRMTADRFVNILDGDGMAFKFARGDGAAIKNQAGNIQPCQSHDACRNGLVAPDKDDERVEKIAASDQFDGVGDDLAADQRSAHTFRAHGDPVRDGNGVEFERSTAGGANTVFDMDCKLAKVIVTGSDLN